MLWADSNRHYSHYTLISVLAPSCCAAVILSQLASLDELLQEHHHISSSQVAQICTSAATNMPWYIEIIPYSAYFPPGIKFCSLKHRLWFLWQVCKAGYIRLVQSHTMCKVTQCTSSLFSSLMQKEALSNSRLRTTQKAPSLLWRQNQTPRKSLRLRSGMSHPKVTYPKVIARKKHRLNKKHVEIAYLLARPG